MNSTHPLPHVSRRAVARVTNPLPAPTECPYCGSPVELVNNSAIYGREHGEWPYAYKCEDYNDDCGAFVGLHPHTDIPLGTLADKALREARKSSKAQFHKLMVLRGWSRGAAYRWLAEQMGVPGAECHFGWFDLERCATAERVCRDAAQ